MFPLDLEYVSFALPVVLFAIVSETAPSVAYSTVSCETAVLCFLLQISLSLSAHAPVLHL